MNSDIFLQPADLIFVGGESKFKLFAICIKFFTRRRGEEPTKMYHVAGMLSRKDVIEALSRVKKSTYSVGKGNHKTYEIGRLKNIDMFQRLSIADYTNRKMDDVYGVGKILFHIGDGILEKISGKNCYFFRKYLKMENYPICSGLGAFAYNRKINYNFGAMPNVVSPDDMYDFVENSDDGECIYKKG